VISAQFLETHPGISPTGIVRFAGIFGAISEGELLLAMQKVEGSNPFSRSRKGLQLSAFLVVPVGWAFCIGMD